MTPDEPGGAGLGGVGGFDPSKLFEQAAQMQQQLADAQAEAAEQVVEGQAGGGVVKVTCTGGLEFRSVTIDRSVLPGPDADQDDIDMLQDLVLAAIHEAVAAANDVNQQALGGLGLGGGLPDLGGLLGG